MSVLLREQLQELIAKYEANRIRRPPFDCRPLCEILARKRATDSLYGVLVDAGVKLTSAESNELRELLTAVGSIPTGTPHFICFNWGSGSTCTRSSRSNH